MAYRRRYFDGEVTSPLIVPEAVTEEKIADEAVTSRKIKDETIKSVDIGAGQVRTEDIADGAVTLSKLGDDVSIIPLEDGAVTTTKLADSAVTTAKIGDREVTEDKIREGSVSSLKLKDGAVITPKIATGAVTPAKLSFVPLTRPLVPPVDATEIGTDAIETDKIKDDAVTATKIKNYHVVEPKIHDDALSIRLFKSFFQRTYFRHFDFFGTNLIGWADSGDGEVRASSALEHGGVGIRVMPTKTHRINWNDFEDLDLQIAKPIWMVAAIPLYKTYVTIRLSLVHDANNFVEFKAEDNVGGTPNWYARCMKGGVLTEVDTGVAVKDAVTEYQLQHMRIEVMGPAEVRFYIDNALKATITTNVFTDYTEPQMEITNNHGSAGRWLFPEYSTILGQRWS